MSPIQLDIVVPVYNEAKILRRNVSRLKAFLKKQALSWQITLAVNGSTDRSGSIARTLSRQSSRVRLVELEPKGRGRALRQAWLSSSAPWVAYMDADLSVDLKHVQDWLAGMQAGFDVVVGSRNLPGSCVRRTWLRTCLSKGYSFMSRWWLALPVSDCQCGFKLLKRSVFVKLAPKIRNQNWFFDTELLFWAHRSDYQIREVPVSWLERKRGKVKIAATVLEDLAGLWRLRFSSK